MEPGATFRFRYTVTDADVDAWNADVQANVLPLFPNVTYVDISNALNKDPRYFIYDSTHPNDEGHAILARVVFDALSSLNRSSGAQSRRNAFPTDYAIEFFPAAGDTITPSTDMGDVIVVNLPAGNVTIPANQKVPAVGAVLDVRYLYAYRESGCLYQPTFLGVRQDVEAHECVASQLKFKSGDEDDA